jgi:hypothetical protein
MTNKLVKRHKRQVARARERVRLSQPDLRTREQVAAAREASRGMTSQRNDHRAPYSTLSPSSAVVAAPNSEQAEPTP